VKGFCLSRQDIRLFKLTRVRNLTVLDEQFTERAYSASLPPLSPAGPQESDITLKLKIAPEMTYRVYDEFFEESVEKQPDGSFVISVTWSENDWVYSSILSFGEYIEVLEPARIRNIIKGITKKITEKYL
jgi:predicted DNA-binding transcriptional regulator YafY